MRADKTVMAYLSDEMAESEIDKEARRRDALAYHRRKQQELEERRAAYDRDVDAYHARLAKAVAARDARDRSEYEELYAACLAEAERIFRVHVRSLSRDVLEAFYDAEARESDERPLLKAPWDLLRIDAMKQYMRDWETLAARRVAYHGPPPVAA